MTRMTGPDCVVMCNLINTYIHTYIHTCIHTYTHAYIHTYIHVPPWEDQCEWHRMARMAGPDCAVMCNLIYIHTFIHTNIPLIPPREDQCEYLSVSQAASSIGCSSRAESTPSVRNCIRCHLESSGRKVLESVAIRFVSSSMFWKYSRRFLDMVPEGS